MTWPNRPIQNISDAWKDADSNWGKAAVVLIYSFLWTFIAVNVWNMFVPGSLGFKCSFAGTKDPVAKAWIIASLRSSDLLCIAFALYAQQIGMRIANLAFVTTTLAMYGAIGAFMLSSQIHKVAKSAAASECVDNIFGFAFYVFWPAAALICRVVEVRMNPRTGEEYERIQA
jgi:hypothetical protein